MKTSLSQMSYHYVGGIFALLFLYEKNYKNATFKNNLKKIISPSNKFIDYHSIFVSLI